MAVLLGVLVAASFGSGDFLGGRASASTATVKVLTLAQACSLVAVGLVVGLVSARVGAGDIWLGAAAGAANVVGLAVLYRALAMHAAGVVAPITAAVGALVPVAWGLVDGEQPSAVVIAGAVVAIVATVLIAYEPSPAASRRIASGVVEAVAAGAALGASLILFARTSDASGLWPVLAARATAFVLVGAAFVALRASGRLATASSGGSWPRLAVGAGVLDAVANIMILLAVRQGLLVVVAPVAALAPAFTVGLAWIVVHERLHVTQRLGLVVALLGVALVAAG